MAFKSDQQRKAVMAMLAMKGKGDPIQDKLRRRLFGSRSRKNLVLFHGTTMDRVGNISLTGLKPQKDRGGVVFFTPYPSWAVEHAVEYMHPDDAPSLLAALVPKKDIIHAARKGVRKSAIADTSPRHPDRYMREFYVEGTVPPSRLLDVDSLSRKKYHNLDKLLDDYNRSNRERRLRKKYPHKT